MFYYNILRVLNLYLV